MNFKIDTPGSIYPTQFDKTLGHRSQTKLVDHNCEVDCITLGSRNVDAGKNFSNTLHQGGGSIFKVQIKLFFLLSN